MPIRNYETHCVGVVGFIMRFSNSRFFVGRHVLSARVLMQQTSSPRFMLVNALLTCRGRRIKTQKKLKTSFGEERKISSLSLGGGSFDTFDVIHTSLLAMKTFWFCLSFLLLIFKDSLLSHRLKYLLKAFT